MKRVRLLDAEVVPSQNLDPGGTVVPPGFMCEPVWGVVG